jgi:hypothetical protein
MGAVNLPVCLLDLVCRSVGANVQLVVELRLLDHLGWFLATARFVLGEIAGCFVAVLLLALFLREVLGVGRGHAWSEVSCVCLAGRVAASCR